MGVLLVVILLILIGTALFSLVEGWSLVDSFYFSVVTLTTVGYGDFSPETTAGKLSSVVYIFLGLSVIATFGSSIMKVLAERITARHVSRKGEDQAKVRASSRIRNE